MNSKRFDTIVFDLGGVLMTHNMQGCIKAFVELMGEDNMHHVLGLGSDGEGVEGTLMERYECGNISTQDFVSEILRYSREGATAEDVKSAWITMHGGISKERLEYLTQLKNSGYRLFLLSNNNELHWNDVLTKYHLEKYFDKLFASHIIHCSKPCRRIFEEVAAAIGSNAVQTVFIDDLKANRLMAEETVGWHTCESIEALKTLL